MPNLNAIKLEDLVSQIFLHLFEAVATNITVATGQGAIPKQRQLPRTNSQSSAIDDLESGLIVPGKKLGKEKKGVLNLIRKGPSKKGW